MLHFDNVRVCPCKPGFSIVLSRKNNEKEAEKISQIQSFGVHSGREMRASLIIYNRHWHNYHYCDPSVLATQVSVICLSLKKKNKKIQSLGVRSGREVSESLVIYNRHRHNYHYNAPFCQRPSQSLQHKFQLSFFLSFKGKNTKKHTRSNRLVEASLIIYNRNKHNYHYNTPFWHCPSQSLQHKFQLSFFLKNKNKTKSAKSNRLVCTAEGKWGHL